MPEDTRSISVLCVEDLYLKLCNYLYKFRFPLAGFF